MNKIAFLCLTMTTMAVIGDSNASTSHSPIAVLAYPRSVDSYEGGAKDGVPHGKGICNYKHGEIYEGDWVDGQREGKGSCIYDGWVSYEGDWVNDMKEGKGKQTMIKSGIKYVGEWSENLANGQGILMDKKDNVLFKGKWKNNIGYEGAVNSKDEPQGKGIMVEIFFGDIYDGNFENGIKKGYGKKSSINGLLYEGYWIDNKANGKGRLKDKDGNVLFEGIWKDGLGYDGVKNSRGEAHGTGRSIDIAGVRYEGDFVNGHMEGVGTVTFPSGNVQTGLWRGGEFIEEYSRFTEPYS